MKQSEFLKSILLGGISATVLGFFLILLSIHKHVTLYFEQLDSPSVNEAQIYELLIMGVTVQIAAGSAGSLLAALDTSNQVTHYIAFIGFVIFTIGLYTIGYDRPNFDTFSILYLSLIAPGSGLFVWSCLAKQPKLTLYLIGMATPLFNLFVYPSLLNQIETIPLYRNEFYLFFASMASLCAPLALVQMAILYSTYFNDEGYEAKSKRQSIDFLKMILHTLSASLIIPMYFIQPLYTNFLLHYNSTEYLEVGSVPDGSKWGDLHLLTYLLISGGGAVAGLYFAFVYFSQYRLFMGLPMYIGLIGTTTGWYFLSKTTSSSINEHGSLGFFIGMTYTFCLLDTLLKGNGGVTLVSQLVGAGIVMACMRLSTGFLTLDWEQFTLILTCMSGAVGILELGTYIL